MDTNGHKHEGSRTVEKRSQFSTLVQDFSETQLKATEGPELQIFSADTFGVVNPSFTYKGCSQVTRILQHARLHFLGFLTLQKNLSLISYNVEAYSDTQ
jgi:hypothetical protein